MKLIALLLGLFLEKITTNIFNLHEIRWLDEWFDRGLRLIGEDRGVRGHLITLLFVILPVAPVILGAILLHDQLGNVLYLIFSVLVLFISLGPRDLGAEVDEFSAASARGDEETSHRVARELLEYDPPENRSERGHAVAAAIFIQSSNRTFGVVLWFVLLGPVGAWAFRVTDLMRRRAYFESDRLEHEGKPPAGYLKPVHNVHGLLAWLPSRLTAMSFALAGSFEPATTAWKEYYHECAEHFFEVNDDIVASAGCGALGRKTQEDMAESAVAGAMGAMQLVQRSMIVWLVVVSVMTIAGAAI